MNNMTEIKEKRKYDIEYRITIKKIENDDKK